MRFLVTGASGFIGSHVVDLLTSKGWEVVCPVRNPSNLRYLDRGLATIVPLDELHTTMTRRPDFDYVIHVAGATRALDYDTYQAVNVEWTRYLLNLTIRSGGLNCLKRFVLVSSQAAAGPSPNQSTYVVETDPPRPISLYGRSKLEAEEAVNAHAGLLPITIVRPPTVFGPRDSSFLGIFRCARFRFVPCIAGMDRLVSIIFVKDLTEGILQAALNRTSIGRTYFIANEEPVVWREFVLTVARVLGYRAVPVPVPLKLIQIIAKSGDIIGKMRSSAAFLRSEKFEEMKEMAWICSSERAREDLNWEASTSIDHAIAETGQWYKVNGWL